MQFTTLNAEPAGDEVRLETHRGRKHLVAPVVMVREGVLNGGFLSFEEIAESAVGWNNRPTTAPPEADASGHPVDEDGEFVSANDREHLERMGVGFLQNAEARDDLDTPNGDESPKGLRGEVWVDLEAAKAVGDMAVEAARRLAEGETLEVSTGYFHKMVERPGSFNGERYDHEQFDLMPDHLALLPNERGACSWDDGCGAPRANEALEVLGVDATGSSGAGTAAGAGRAFSCNCEGDSCSCGDAANAETMFERFKAWWNGERGDGEDGDSAESGTTQHDNMTEHDIEALAERTGLSVETLEGMDDDEVASLAESIPEGDDGGDGGDGGAANEEDDTGDGGDGTGDGADPTVATKEDIQALREEVEALREEQNTDPEAESAREYLAENSDHAQEDLEEWPDAAVIEAANARGFAVARGHAAPLGDRVNRLGQGGGASATVTGNGAGEEDLEEYVSTTGALNQLDAAESGGD